MEQRRKRQRTNCKKILTVYPTDRITIYHTEDKEIDNILNNCFANWEDGRGY